MNSGDEPPPPRLASTAPTKAAILIQYRRRRHISGFPKPQPPPITSVFSRKRNKPIPAPEPSMPRRTRDLPNISECHACGFRIDVSSGRDRLQIMYSEWRIVLLCQKCLSRVETSAVCSYCFREVSEGFCCRSCNRRIHKSCFFDYKTTAPWSYSSPGSEFSVCVDCWVPKQLEKSRLLKRKRRFKKKRQVVCALRCDSLKEVGDFTRTLHSSEQGAGVSREVQYDGCERFGDKVVKENVPVPSNSFGAKRNGASAKERNETVYDRIVDDAELAFRLHRSMNSSPRISKKLCLEKASALVYRRMTKRYGKTSTEASGSGSGSFFERVQFCINEPSHTNSDKRSSENSLDLLHNSPENMHQDEADRVVDRGSSQDCTCLVKRDGEDENLHMPVKEGEGSSSNGTGIESVACSQYVEPVMLMDAGNIQKVDRCLVTYCKRLRSNKDDKCKNLYEKISSSE